MLGVSRPACYNLGNVTPRCAWYFPFLSAYETSGASPLHEMTWDRSPADPQSKLTGSWLAERVNLL
jgi:hypothetical protein